MDIYHTAVVIIGHSKFMYVGAELYFFPVLLPISLSYFGTLPLNARVIA